MASGGGGARVGGGAVPASRYRGVHWQKSGQCWVVVVGLAYVGTFLDEKEAALAHDEKAIELYGADAVLNFVRGPAQAVPAERLLVACGSCHAAKRKCLRTAPTDQTCIRCLKQGLVSSLGHQFGCGLWISTGIVLRAHGERRRQRACALDTLRVGAATLTVWPI